MEPVSGKRCVRQTTRKILDSSRDQSLVRVGTANLSISKLKLRLTYIQNWDALKRIHHEKLEHHNRSRQTNKNAFLNVTHPGRLEICGLEAYLSKYTLKFLFFGRLAVPVV
jgi:lauroyl/myristoyl acyltransferase